MSQLWRHSVDDGDDKVVIVTFDDMELGIDKVGGDRPTTGWWVILTAYSSVYILLL